MKRMGLLLLGMFLFAVTSPARGDDKKENAAAVPAPRDKNWEKRHEDFIAEAMKGDVELLLLGDALTDEWRTEPNPKTRRGGKSVFDKELAPLKAVNFGMSGDRTQNLLWRVQNGELAGIKPKVVMLLIGTNNIIDDSSADIAGGIKAVVAEVHAKLPDSKILLLGLFPRQMRADNPQRAKIKEVNAIIAKLDDGGKTIRFLDIGDKFLEKDGSISPEIMPHFVHLSTKGYQVWADAVKGPLREMMGKK